jgi:hypothetical protein
MSPFGTPHALASDPQGIGAPTRAARPARWAWAITDAGFEAMIAGT